MERAREEQRDVVRMEVSVLAEIFSISDLACIDSPVCIVHAVLWAALNLENNMRVFL